MQIKATMLKIKASFSPPPLESKQKYFATFCLFISELDAFEQCHSCRLKSVCVGV